MSHGKKIGQLHVRLDRITRKVRWGASRDQHAEFAVDLRFDISSGTFHVEHDGKWYAAKTKSELEAQVKKAVERTVDLEWERYIIVDYSATARPIKPPLNAPDSSTGNVYGITNDRNGLNERRHPSKICGIELTWELVEYTKPWKRPEDGKRVRSKRDLRPGYVGDGDPVEHDDDSLPNGAVLWTKEREEMLHEILAGLAQLDARMLALFRGDTEELAVKLDGLRADMSQLLPAPVQDLKPRRRRA